jgi:hypothetical protein
MTESAGLVPFRQASCDELVEDAGELVERAIKPSIKLRPPGQGGSPRSGEPA